MPILLKAHDFVQTTCEAVMRVRTVKNISFTFRLFSIIHTDICLGGAYQNGFVRKITPVRNLHGVCGLTDFLIKTGKP